MWYTGNITQRMSVFKEIYRAQHPVEVVIDEWLKRFCNKWLEEEFHMHVRAGRYERTPKRLDYSNGYYRRRLATARGVVQLSVPSPCLP